MKDLKVAVIGAAGAVGRKVVEVLEERNFPVGELRLFATRRSAGQKIPFRGEKIPVEETRPEELEGFQLAFLAVGAEVSRELGPLLASRGTVVIDKSSAFRLEPEIPLVVPEVNGEELRHHRGIVASPNCSTIQMVMVLEPLRRVAGIRRVVVSTYQSVSGTGEAAVGELEEQVRGFVRGERPEPRVYPRPIAFNLLPHIDSFGELGYTGEEWKLVRETRKIMGIPDLPVSATAVRVPVFWAHSEAVSVELERPLSPEEARATLSSFPGVRVVDDPEKGLYPTPLEAAGRDEVFVGRIRESLAFSPGLEMWVVADNLRKGAATNAVQIAETLLREGLLEPLVRAGGKI